MEKEFLVKPIAIKYICNFCKEGEMEPTGENDWSLDIPKFKHRCNKCGEELFLDKKYPQIKYKLINM